MALPDVSVCLSRNALVLKRANVLKLDSVGAFSVRFQCCKRRTRLVRDLFSLAFDIDRVLCTGRTHTKAKWCGGKESR